MQGYDAVRVIALAFALAAFWFINSGFLEPLILAFGALSIVITLYFAVAMRTADEEGLPIQAIPGALTYWPWLLWQMLLSAWAVAQIVVHPKLPISPTLTRVRSHQKTAAGRATYANSITLTPGTITVEVAGDVFTVHALVREGADDVETGAMDRRVDRFEGKA